MRVQPYLRRMAAEGRAVERVGPFDAHFNPGSASEGSNYAIPVDGAAPSAADLAELVDAFELRGRTPRLEFLPVTAPAAERALLHAGFEEELRTPVMTCLPGRRRRPRAPEGLTLHHLRPGCPQGEVEALLRVQAAGFGEALDPVRLELAQRWLGRWTTVLARVDGEPAGGGMSLGVHDGTAELVGIATAERFRRRGVAGAVTSELTRLVHALGGRHVFLTPGDEGAQRAYARAGFERTETMLHLRLPGGRAPTRPPPGPRD